MSSARPTPPPVLLLHPAPGEDEVFSSWLTRVALANGLRPPALVLALGHGQVFRRDPDLSAPDDLLIRLAGSTRQNPERVLQTGLRPLLTPIHGEVRPTAHLAFLVALGNTRGVERARGHPVCLACLAEDGQVRRSWRLTTTVVCERHGLALTDRCLHCGHPFSLLRPQLARATRRRAPFSRPASWCPNCQRQMESGPPLEISLLESALMVQHWMGQALSVGRVDLPDLTLPVHDFTKLLTLTLAVIRQRRVPLPPCFRMSVFQGKPMLEHASPEQRLSLIAGAGFLLRAGVSGLFRAFHDAGLRSRDVLPRTLSEQVAPWLRDLNFDALSHRPHARRLVPLALQLPAAPVVFGNEHWEELAPLLPPISRGGGGTGGRKSDREALEAVLTRSLTGTRQGDWQGEMAYVTFYRRLGRLAEKGCLNAFFWGLITLLERDLGAALPGSEVSWNALPESLLRLLLALTSPELIRALERVESRVVPLLWQAGIVLSLSRVQELLQGEVQEAS